MLFLTTDPIRKWEAKVSVRESCKRKIIHIKTITSEIFGGFLLPMAVGPKSHMRNTRKYTIYNSVTRVCLQATRETSNHSFIRRSTFNSEITPFPFWYENIFSALRVITDGGDLTWKKMLATQCQSPEFVYNSMSGYATQWGVSESFGKSVFKQIGTPTGRLWYTPGRGEMGRVLPCTENHCCLSDYCYVIFLLSSRQKLGKTLHEGYKHKA